MKSRQQPIGQGRTERVFQLTALSDLFQSLETKKQLLYILRKTEKMLEHVVFILKTYIPQSQVSHG